LKQVYTMMHGQKNFMSRKVCFTQSWSVFKVTVLLSFNSFTVSKHRQQWPSELNFDRKKERQ